VHPARLLDQPGNAPTNGVVQANRFYKFRSYDKSFPFIAVFGADIPPPLHEKLADVLPLIEVLVDKNGAPEQWVDNHRFPRGKVLMSLGMGGTAESETRAIAASNNIKDAPFTEEVEDAVFKEFIIPSSDRLKELGRRDLRDEEFVCTIDPATARDLDDAISITKTSGGYRVGVHIADVSYFVPLGNPVDLEARDRCTSTYFVERVIPMLPHKLCEDYCSLNAGEDKFAFSCIFQMDNNGVITSEWFGQSIIRNRCRMAYEDAQNIIEGNLTGDSLVFHEEELKTSPWPKEELTKKVVSSVTMMFELASKMRAARYEAGCLSLNKSKLKFRFDDINARVAPIGFGLDGIHEANWMVEQFMLLANIRVAEKIVEFLPQSALLRKHDSPDVKKLRAFKDAAAKHGIKLSVKTSKGLNDSLAKYSNDPRSDSLRLMATYNMMLAKYISSGEDETNPVDHYALATPCYTHFTSPIRRYADLMVHRQLLLALEIEQQVKRNANNNNANATVDVSLMKNKQYYFTHYEVSDIADRCNQQKERARKCSDASLKLFFCLYLEAIRIKSHVDKSIFPTQWVSAEVVRIKDGSFTIYASEIGSDCEIAFNSRNQHWRGECKFDKDSNSVILNWGPGQGQGEGSEDQEEAVGLFHRVTASLLVTRDQGLMKLDMILDAPWNRDRFPVGVRKVL
ncbi:ribonuclease II-like protein, putative, partial [Bodo saltans]